MRLYEGDTNVMPSIMTEHDMSEHKHSMGEHKCDMIRNQGLASTFIFVIGATGFEREFTAKIYRSSF